VERDERLLAGDEFVVVEPFDLLARIGVEVLRAEGAAQRPRLRRVVVDELGERRLGARLFVRRLEAGLQHPAHVRAVLDLVAIVLGQLGELEAGGGLRRLQRLAQLLHAGLLRLRGDLGQLAILGRLGRREVGAGGERSPSAIARARNFCLSPSTSGPPRSLRSSSASAAHPLSAMN
jgi:hypothetical protein